MNSRKKLTVVCGNAGVGKTTLGAKIAAQQGAALLDIDTVSEQLVVAGLKALGSDPDDRDSPAYKRIYRDAIHETLFSIAEQNLDWLPCVLVAPFTQERRREGFLEELKERFFAPVELIYVTCSDEQRKARIIARGNPRDRGKLEAWDEYAQAGRDRCLPPFAHTLVDTTNG